MLTIPALSACSSQPSCKPPARRQLREVNMHSATWKTDIIIGTWRLLQLTAGATAYPAFSRPTWRFVENQMNAQKFIVNLPFAVALAAGIAIVDSDAGWQAARAQAIPHIQARVIATNIPGASAISQVGTF